MPNTSCKWSKNMVLGHLGLGLDVSDPEKAGCTTWISDDSSHPKSELNFQPLRACMLVE